MNSSLILIALTCTAFAPTEAKLRTLDGQSHSGRIVQIDDRQVVLSQGGSEKAFSPSQLHTLDINPGKTNTRWKVQVALLDGSLLQGTAFTASQGKGRITFGDNSQRELPIKSILWVRLREQQGELADQWDEYLAEDANADRLIIRRKAGDDEESGQAAAESLDVMEGIVGDISESTVNFEIDGDTLRVKRERVDGVVYFRGREATLPSAACFMVDDSGSRWAVKAVESTDDKLKFSTPTGVTVELPLAQVRKIDYAGGNLQYLGDLARDRTMRQSWVTSEEDGAGESLLFEPLRGRTPEGNISIGGSLYPDGLWMPARSSLVVRIPQGFKRFRAQVGIDDRVTATDGARLLIEGDGKVLLDQVIEREARPTPIDIDLAEARRVRITVDYGGESFLGDQLVLCEAMFTK